MNENSTQATNCPAIREGVHYGCPYCIGPIYFTYDAVLKHMRDEHSDWRDPGVVDYHA